jgi:hypothetical protein
LPEPIAPPSKTLLAKRTTKSDVSAPNWWICAISAHSGVARALRSSPNDRSDAPSPDLKRSPPSKLPRAYTCVQKDLLVCKLASRAVMVWHAPPRASSISNMLPRALDLMAHEFHASMRSLAHEMHTPHSVARLLVHAPHVLGIFPTPRAYWRVRCTRHSASTLWCVHHTRQALLITLQLPRVLQRVATSALAFAMC